MHVMQSNWSFKNRYQTFLDARPDDLCNSALKGDAVCCFQYAAKNAVATPFLFLLLKVHNPIGLYLEQQAKSQSLKAINKKIHEAKHLLMGIAIRQRVPSVDNGTLQTHTPLSVDHRLEAERSDAHTLHRDNCHNSSTNNSNEPRPWGMKPWPEQRSEPDPCHRPSTIRSRYTKALGTLSRRGGAPE